MDKDRVRELEKICKHMREDCLIMAKAAGESGLHFGGTFSMIELMAVLYLEVMNISKEKLSDELRDRFILSKGHGVPAVYAVLKQLQVVGENELTTFKKDETRLYGHPCMNGEIGIEFSSGSLGQGVSLAVGTAMALKRKKNETSRVFVLVGDGECDEGSIWEAAMSASHYRLNNLSVIIDCNCLQYDGKTDEVMSTVNLEEKWKSFGFEVVSIDGHNIEMCYNALELMSDKPRAIIANTVKGKGISFMENNQIWHHKKLTKSQEEQAWKELESIGN